MSSRARQFQRRRGSSERVYGVAELEQAMLTLLTTPLGSVPSRPTFGTVLYQYTDSPLSLLRPRVVREVTRAVRLHEPRVEVERVTIDAELAEEGRARAMVTWRPSAVSGVRVEDSRTTEVLI